MRVFGSRKRSRGADLVPGTACAPGTVHVVLVVVGAVVVHHQDELLHVQAASCHRGGHHQATGAVLEVADDAVAVVLVDP